MNALLRAVLLVLAAAALPACDSDPTVEARQPDFRLSAPGNGANGVAGTPTFAWEESYGTTTYALEVSPDSAFSTRVINETGLALRSFTPAAPLNPGTVYYWRVTAERPTGNIGSTGGAWSFTTLAPTPGAFTLSAPGNGTTGVSTVPMFSWTASPGAASYRLQIGTSAGLGSLVLDQGGILTTSATPSVTLTANTVYYWQVLAESSTSVPATGAPWSFTTQAGAPGTFAMLSPSNGSTFVSRTPTFTWNPSTDATSYRIEVASDVNFNSVELDQSGIVGTSFTTSTPLLPLRTYYWRVTATGTGGTTPASPSPLSFTTSS